MYDQSPQSIANGIKLAVVDLPISNKPQKFPEAMKKIKKKIIGKRKPSYMTMFLAEFIGTGLLMFLGCMGCVSQVDSPAAVHHMSSIAFGLVILLIIQLFGHVSGAHLNPAVTLATVLFQYLTPIMGVVYVIAQFVGATVGFGLLKILLPDDYTNNGFCVTKPHEKTTPMQALGIEIVITTVLILVCCAIWDKKNAHKDDSIPLRFGFIIAAISMCAGPFTGASMNTARSFAPVVFYGNWEDQWIYLVGPNIAPVLGCGLYKYVFSEEEEEDNNKEDIYLDENAHNLEKL